jgi:hypothetical protein
LDNPSRPSVAFLSDEKIEARRTPPIGAFTPWRDRALLPTLLLVAALCAVGTLCSFWLPSMLVRLVYFGAYFLISGYLLRYLKCIVDSGQYNTPALSDVTKSVLPFGLVAFLIDTVYTLPAVLLIWLLARLTITGYNSTFYALSQMGTLADVWSPSLAGSLSGGLTFIVLAVIVVFGVICGIFIPAAQLRFAASGNIGDALNAPAVLRYVGKHAKDYALYLVAMMLIFGACAHVNNWVVYLLTGHHTFYFWELGFWHGVEELFIRTLANLSMFIASFISTALLGRFYLHHRE